MDNNERFEVRLAIPERQFVKVYRDFLQSELLSAEEKLVYIALKSFVSYGSDDGEVFPSMETLCKYTSMSRPRVTRTIEKLEKKGIVSKKRRGATQTNVYILSDNTEMWKSQTEDELRSRSKIQIQFSTTELLEELKRRGIEVITTHKKEEPTSDTHTDISSKNLEHLQTTKNYNEDNPKKQVELYSMENLKSLYGFSALGDYNSEDVDAVFNILYDVLNTTKDTVRVGGEDKSASVVKGKLLKLDYDDIAYVIDRYNEQSDRIKNPQAYILTQLYRAKEQNHLDMMNMGHHNGDF